MKNYKITIEFDGSRYKGWQKQKDNDASIQDKIETVLLKMTGKKVELIGCGRVDIGVHAENYIANFQTECPLSIDRMINYLYEYLPEDIVVKAMEEVDERFHARYNVKSKTYVYKINNSRFRTVFDRKYTYHTNEKLNLNEMKKAAELLIGEHDFKNLATVKPNTKSTVKTVNYININDDVNKNGGMIEIEVNANEFLLNMQKNIIAILLEVGKRNLRPLEVEKMLNDNKKLEQLSMLKVKALCLRDVQY